MCIRLSSNQYRKSVSTLLCISFSVLVLGGIIALLHIGYISNELNKLGGVKTNCTIIEKSLGREQTGDQIIFNPFIRVKYYSPELESFVTFDIYQGTQFDVSFIPEFKQKNHVNTTLSCWYFPTNTQIQLENLHNTPLFSIFIVLGVIELCIISCIGILTMIKCFNYCGFFKKEQNETLLSHI